MWTDFSEVRSCLHVDFGERDKRERAFGSLSFSSRRPLFVGDGLFPCSQSSTPSLNLFSTSTFLSPPPQKKNSKKQCIRDTDDPRKCKALRDDYLECLHHRKEIARLNAVYREQKKADAAAAAAGGDKGGAAAADKKH